MPEQTVPTLLRVRGVGPNPDVVNFTVQQVVPTIEHRENGLDVQQPPQNNVNLLNGVNQIGVETDAPPADFELTSIRISSARS